MESARLGLARSARVCDFGTHVSELELEFLAAARQPQGEKQMAVSVRCVRE